MNLLFFQTQTLSSCFQERARCLDENTWLRVDWSTPALWQCRAHTCPQHHPPAALLPSLAPRWDRGPVLLCDNRLLREKHTCSTLCFRLCSRARHLKGRCCSTAVFTWMKAMTHGGKPQLEQTRNLKAPRPEQRQTATLSKIANGETDTCALNRNEMSYTTELSSP